jgi:hypothetical protein
MNISRGHEHLAQEIGAQIWQVRKPDKSCQKLTSDQLNDAISSSFPAIYISAQHKTCCTTRIDKKSSDIMLRKNGIRSSDVRGCHQSSQAHVEPAKYRTNQTVPFRKDTRSSAQFLQVKTGTRGISGVCKILCVYN